MSRPYRDVAQWQVRSPLVVAPETLTDVAGADGVSEGTRDNISALAHFSEQEAAAISIGQRTIERLSAHC